MLTFLHRFILATLLCLLGGMASAHHLHYIPLSDTRYPGLLVDTFGETPLEEWVIYEGDDQYSSFDEATNTYSASQGTGVATAIFDYPYFDDINNPQITAFWEIEVVSLNTSGIQTIEMLFTDLDNDIKWDEAAGTIIGTKAGLGGDSVVGLPPLSAVGELPLRVQMYYHFKDFVVTIVVIDDATGASTSFSWQGSVNPFVNFFDDGIGGTDPDNLDIYGFVLCEAECEVRTLNYDRLNCTTVAGAVDYLNCGAIVPSAPQFIGVLQDEVEAFLIDEHSTGDLFDVDSNNGNGGGTDADIGYAISSGNTDIDGDSNPPFVIDPITGLIRINDPDDLDVESGTDHFILTIRATDLTDMVSADVFIVVLLRDIDDTLSDAVDSGQWHLLSPLALDNNGNTSVGQVVGDDILIANLDSTLYADGDNGGWIMYRNDDANDIYQVLNLNSVLAVGRGYWLKTLSSGQQFGVTGTANALTPILLEAAPNPADGRFNMLGHPFDYSVCWSDVQISNDGFSTTLSLDDVDPVVNSSNICDSDPSNPSCIMSRKMYQWNGSAFQTFDGVTPGAEGTLDVFDGFFVKAYKAGYELRVPATPGCMTLRRQRAHALVSSPVRPARVAEAGEWSIRLIVSAGPLRDPGNLLGRLNTSEDSFDAHDLDELPADFDPYLTLVFPRPDWGEQTGDYTSDFRALASSRRGVTDWDFEIRSDQPREITLSWEIPTQDLRDKSRLIDLENKLTRRPKHIEQYTVRMTGTSHRFTWRLRNGR